MFDDVAYVDVPSTPTPPKLVPVHQRKVGQWAQWMDGKLSEIKWYRRGSLCQNGERKNDTDTHLSWGGAQEEKSTARALTNACKLDKELNANQKMAIIIKRQK
jgi:hypothetical protein